MEWQLIESDDALRRLLADGAGSEFVVVDTEFMRRNTFYPQVALVQLCFSDGPVAGTAWLVDPLAITASDRLAGLLTDPGVTKVLHSASEDLEVFQHWLGVLPQPMFDTQRAAAMVGIGFGLGYRALVHELCDVDLPKGETRSDWLQRPLTSSQCDYAAQDVTWLLDVYRKLSARCDELGRRDWVLADGADAAAGLASSNGGYYRRIKGAWKLDTRQLATLIAVSDWREATARERDKPRSWIIDDKSLLQLAQRAPRNRSQLQAGVEMHSGAQRRYGDELLDLLAAQRDLPDSALPARLPPPLDAQQRQQIKQLKEAAREIALRLGMAPEVLLQARDYEALLRESEGASDKPPGHWSGWRQAVVIEPLRQLLREGRQ
jgi:ribonuclease D